MLWQKTGQWWCLSSVLKYKIYESGFDLPNIGPFTSKGLHNVKHGLHFPMLLKHSYELSYECHMKYVSLSSMKWPSGFC